jgi:hypothetical protein
VRFGDAHRNRQAEAGAFAYFLGRKEWLEHAPGESGRHTGAIVLYLDRHHRVDAFGRHRQRAAAMGGAHRLLGVEDKVQDDLLNLFGIDDDVGQTFTIAFEQSDIRRTELVRSQRDGGFDDVVDADDGALGRRAPYECQQVAYDLPCANRF